VEFLLGSGERVVATDSRPEEELGLGRLGWRERGVELVLGRHPETVLDGIDRVIVSPGVPTDAPLIRLAAERGVPVIGELELAFESSRASWIAVTGTNGKTTTTALTGALVETTGRQVLVGGNIGNALAGAVGELDEEGIVVAEVSSFQLDTAVTFRPHVAVLLNIREDHLDRYGTMDAYATSKARVFMNQTADDFAVLNVDEERVARLGGEIRGRVVPVSTTREVEGGVFVRGGRIVSRVRDREENVLHASELAIPGPHNLANAVAALGAAFAVGVETGRAAEALRRFRPLEHRLEFVAEIDGVRYVNDSKATNVDSVACALASYGVPIVLIAGGRGKGADYSELRDGVQRGVAHVVLIGEAADAIEETLAGIAPISRAATLREAVDAASRAAAPGSVVLLSPACASFDMFDDYEDRGRQFKNEVARLAAERAKRD